eukprot:COSAG02_NODE_70636_length_194_cov_142.105263_1_plen_64_part_11
MLVDMELLATLQASAQVPVLLGDTPTLAQQLGQVQPTALHAMLVDMELLATLQASAQVPVLLGD